MFHSVRVFMSLLGSPRSICTASVICRSIASFLYVPVTLISNSCISPLWTSRQCRHNGEFVAFRPRRSFKEGGFDSVLFVPSTPDGKLKRAYQKEITRSGHRIKVVEKTGTTLKRQLQTSNPFKPQQCGGKIGKGESGATHTSGGMNTWRIFGGETQQTHHSGDIVWRFIMVRYRNLKWKMKVTRTYRNDAMLRQITEAMQIDQGTPTVYEHSYRVENHLGSESQYILGCLDIFCHICGK